MSRRFARLLLLFSLTLLVSCTDDATAQHPNGFVDGGTDGGAGLCPVTISYKPAPGTSVSSVSVAGEWNAFDKDTDPLSGPDADGAYTATVKLAPGMWAYKLVVDGDNWQLDPEQGYRKYVGGEENSAVRVADCTLPSLVVDSHQTAPSSFSAKLRYVAPIDGAKLDLTSVSATIRQDEVESPLDPSALSVTADGIDVNVPALSDGKYTIKVSASDDKGRAVAESLRLVFWIEKEAFDWRDALIYMIVTDRFKDGDPSNDPPPTPGVQDPRTDWHGGDLEGVREKIADGTLDKLGVRALWLTPFQTNPTDPFPASDGTHLVTGYHGYWPVKAREVDPRLGGKDALIAMVKAAHEHGIRVLMDFVVNHVHKEHEYFKAHPDWFRTGCVCGTNNCDWTAQRLTCLFADYMPDVNWTVPEVSEQYMSDAVWWIDTFDLDGLRMDAVKHVEEAAVTNLSTRIHAEFDAAGTHTFLMGETAMGWTDCGSVACNADQYDTISEYIGPHKLDGQFDFVLYHAVPYRVFAGDEHGLIHADFWEKGSIQEYPAGSVMVPYIGSHDTARFTTLATYRGQPGYDGSIPGNQWSNTAAPPPDAEPYDREALGLSWLLGLPGAPLLYYGDEYGEWGGVDPGNRADWRGDQTLSSDEQRVLDRVRKLGTARRDLVALRRGDYETLLATETFLAFARVAGSDVAIVALSKDTAQTTTSVTLPPALGLSDGTTLVDHLGGSSVTVSGGAISVTLPAWGAAVLAK